MATNVTPITVSATEPTPPPAAPVTPAAAAPDTTAAELAALKLEVADHKRAAEFWQSRATTPAPAPAAPAAPVAEPEPEEVDILDMLATQGSKGFDAFMKKRGYVSRTEAEALVQGAVNAKGEALSTEAELLSNYPDLKDKDSDFFKQTALNYGELKRQGVSEALAMKLGAQQAELQGFRSGKVKTPAQAAADTAAQKEAARVARVKAQSGDKTARASAEEEEDDGELTPQQKHICVAMGISEDAYKARAQKGVQMGGLGKK